MTDCIFCKIIAGEIPSEKVYEDEHSLAFMDINPGTAGHCLVIPKKHAETIVDIPDSDMQKLSLTVKKVASAIMQSIKPEGLNLHQSNGAMAGQVVPHFHMHLLPRYESDSVGHLWRPGDGGSDIADQAAQIRSMLS